MVESRNSVYGYSTPVNFIARFLLELKQTYFSSGNNNDHTEVRRKINYSLEMPNNRSSLFFVDLLWTNLKLLISKMTSFVAVDYFALSTDALSACF